MKGLLKAIKVILILCLLPVAINAQTKITATSKQKVISKKPAPPVSNKEIIITIKNLAEKTVHVFIGPKEELKNPKAKLKMLGGLSKNAVSVKVSDVICIMNTQDKPTACTDLKATTTIVEVNSSGNGISGK